jgi:hypothetical protein
MEPAVKQETFVFSVPLATHPDVEALYHSSGLGTSDRIAFEDMPFQCDFPSNPLGTEMMMGRPPSCYIYSIDSFRESMYSMALDVDSFDKTLLQDDLAGDFAPVLASVATKKRKGFVTPEKLACNWKIGIELARVTLANTTQRVVRDFTHSTMGRS